MENIDVRITQYPRKVVVSDFDIFLIADVSDVDVVTGFPKYKKVLAKDLPSIVNTAENITYAELLAQSVLGELVVGEFYNITDSTSGVAPLLVQAISDSAIGYLAFDGDNPLVTINYDFITDTIRWSKDQTSEPVSLDSFSAVTPLSYDDTTGVFTISQSSAVNSGYLSATDWATFSAKQNALSGSGLVKSTSGTISYITDNSSNWNSAYNDTITSASVTGTTSKLLTLTQRDGGTITASWGDLNSVTSVFGRTGDVISAIGDYTTTQVTEGTNLYYTQDRFNTAFGNKTTSDLPEGTNLYYLDTRARASISNTVTGLTYTPLTGVLSTTAGYGIPTTATQANWDTAYTNRITSAASPLSITSNAISISQANVSTNGYLSATDWNTFNSKQDAGNYITALTGEATASGPNSASVTLSNSAVIGKVLTGLNVTGGSISASDSILNAFGKVQNQINGLIGGSIYQGVWNASTNNPALASGVGTQGYYYIVSVAGSTNLDGITDWNIGDWAIFDGTAWQQVDNTDAVVSVNGQVGIVNLTTTNIAEGTNLYYTDVRVSANSDVSANTAARHNAVTLGTANGLSLATQQLSLALSSASANGALSSTDWSTFSAKQNALSGTGIVKSVSGTISYLTDNSANWNTAYNDSIISAGVTGTTTKTLTLNQQDGGTITASWTDDNTDAVISVFGRTGAVIAASGDYTTTQVTEGTNLYYTEGRVDANSNVAANTAARHNAVTIGTANGLSLSTQQISLGLSSGTTTGALSSTDWTTFNSKQNALGFTPEPAITAGTTAQYWRGDKSFQTLDTSVVPENTNLYYTSARFDTAFGTKTTTNLTEGTNLYFTDSRARAAITLTTTGTSGPSTYIGGTLNIPDYSSALSGYLPLSGGTLTGDLFGTNATFTGVVSVKGAAPYYQWLNASNTRLAYIQHDGSDLVIATDTGDIVLNPNGKVGIKNSNPSQNLTVGDGTGTGNQYVRVNASASDIYIGQSGGTLFGQSANSAGFVLSDNTSFPFAVGTIAAQDFILGTNNTVRFTINGSTGAITATSSITASSFVKSGGTSSQALLADGSVGTFSASNWNTAYNDSIVSAAVTGTSTKLLTLNQQDGGTITASWSESSAPVVSVFGRTGAILAAEGDYSLTQLSDVTITTPSNGQVLKYNGTSWVNGTDTDTGLTSVGLSMPSAFTVSNSPLTANGTLAVTGAGVASQYVRGDGTLAAFPTSTGGGSSVSYYFNGGTSQGTIGGNTYYEMSKIAVIGTGADFNINANGYIAQFVTDANDPALLTIPAGNWNFEMWFSASSNGGSPSFYLELYKYDGATLTLISSGSAVPESITGGTAIDLYTTALAVPTTALTITDRLAVRVYVNHSGRTITLHTQNGHLCQAITTFSTGLTALNGLTNQVQYLAVGTSGTDFAVSSVTDTHTFNLPTASATNRGALNSADWSAFNGKQNALTLTTTGTSGAATLVGATLNIPNYGSALANYLPLSGGTLTGNLNGTSATFSGVITLPQNPVGTTYGNGVSASPLYMITQGAGDNDAIRFYAESGATNTVTMVFEVNDDIETAGSEWIFRNKQTYGVYAATTPFRISGAGAAYINGDTVLHAGNFGSYALPLAGGTMTGIITTVSSGTAINFSGQTDSFGYNVSSGLGTYIKGTGNTFIYGGGVFYDGTASRTLIHSGNIGSQSVSYATTAGALTSMNISQFTNDSGYITSSALSGYLPLTGGTLTGNLTGTTSLFSNSVATTSHGNSGKWVASQTANGNFIPYSFEAEYGNHSWGIIARFRINQANADRPSIQFSNATNDTRWNIGYCYSDDNFRVTQNMGYRNDNTTSDSWGTERLKIDTSGNTYAAIGGTLYANGNIVLDAANYTSYAATVGHTHDLGRYSLQAPAYIDGLTGANFRSTLFGHTNNNFNISTARWNTTPAILSGLGAYGTMIAWSGADTQGFIAMDYASGNAKIGGGNGNNINWTAILLHSSNYNSYAPTLTGTGASGTWGIDITGNAATAGNSTTTSQRNFSGDISTTGMGRFTGWYNGNAATGLAAEIGISAGQAYIIAYNRGTNNYGTLNFESSAANLQIVGSVVNVTSGSLQQGGNQVLHAGNYNSYAVSSLYGYDVPMGQTGDWIGMSTASGISGWTHVINMAWSQNSQADWVSQIAFATQTGTGAYYRTTSGPITSAAWIRLLDASNVGSYALPIGGGTLTGNLTISRSAADVFLKFTNGTNTYGWNLTTTNKFRLYDYVNETIIVDIDPAAATSSFYYANFEINSSATTGGSLIFKAGTAANTWAINKNNTTGLSITKNSVSQLSISATGETTLVSSLSVTGGYISVGQYGLSSSTYSAFIRRNDTSSYGAWDVTGVKGGYTGFVYNTTNLPHTMFDSSGNGGLYYQTGSRWIMYYNYADNCIGIGGVTTNPSFRVRINGPTQFSLATTFANNIIVTQTITNSVLGTGIVYSSSGTLTSTNPSDIRLKQDIKPLEYGLNEIMALNPVKFKWKDGSNNGEEQVGLIAQNVQEVMPDLVKNISEDSEFLGLDSYAINIVLINAIKELQERIKILENK